MTKAPEIVGDKWYNSKPLTKENLQGEIILYDFWTYSCVNCLRSLPHLKDWWGKYKDKGLIIIGIHTPEFEFEKNPENINKAIKDLKIDWPVVLDNENLNWNNFGNQFWPAKYLADRNGNIVLTHFGEGSYEEIEKQIQNLLELKESSKPQISKEAHEHGATCFKATPELYCGYKRGKIPNPGGYHYDHIANYELPDPIKENSIALKGRFFAGPEYVESFGPDSKLIVNFDATEVNLVMEPVLEDAVVKIIFNDEELLTEIKGKDIKQNSEVIVTEPRMYNLLKNESHIKGTLKIVPIEGNFRAYAFTFSGCIKK